MQSPKLILELTFVVTKAPISSTVDTTNRTKQCPLLVNQHDKKNVPMAHWLHF
jgi:hypothetical protein